MHFRTISLRRVAVWVAISLLAIVLYYSLSRWWPDLRASDRPAWAQAIGTILALAITIVLNRIDARERRIERDARARNAGIVVRPVLAEIRDELKEAIKEIDEGSSPHSVGRYEEGEQNYGLAGIWTTPPKLTDKLHAMAELGRAAKDAQAAYLSLEELHRTYTRHYIEEIGECFYDDVQMNLGSIAATRRTILNLDAAISSIDQLYK